MLLVLVYFSTKKGSLGSNKGRSKKWKKLLQFPHINECYDLRGKLSKKYSNFEFD